MISNIVFSCLTQLCLRTKRLPFLIGISSLQSCDAVLLPFYFALTHVQEDVCEMFALSEMVSQEFSSI